MALRASAAQTQLPGMPRGDGEPPAEPAITPPLPTDGLFETETWIALGTRLLVRLVDAIPSLLTALLVLAFFFALAWLSNRLMRGLVHRTGADPALETVVSNLVTYVILIFGALMAAAQAGLQVGSLLAGVGIVGLAIGLAAQESLANLVAGLTILWDRPFRTGDNVTIAGTFGEVVEIRIRTTRVRTFDRRHVILPNKMVIEDKITNHTMSPELRLDVPVGIAYSEDIRRAREVLLESVAGHPMLEQTNRHEVVVIGLGESSVDLELRVWLRDPRQERRAFVEVIERAKLALDAAGIEIPFPQRTLHWKAESPSLHIATSRSPAEDRSRPEESG
jgi:small conductance mechanosensitive channel